MTSVQSNAPCSGSGGVVHIRVRQTSHFTVLANRLAQRAGSAVTVGVAAYILSLPDGAPVTIAALCAHFAEGKTTIAAALRELEAEGWLERRVVRGEHGRLTTRTVAYDLPGAAPEPVPTPECVPAPVPEPVPEPLAEPDQTEPEATAVTPVDRAAERLLAELPRHDRRLLLSEREIASLAPAVADWLARGATPDEITATLTTGLPDRITRRPARLLAYRLAALRPPARAADTSPAGRGPDPGRPPAIPIQNCDGCDRGFRSPHPGRCRDCRSAEQLPCAA